MNPKAFTAAVALKTELEKPTPVLKLYDIVEQLEEVDRSLHESNGEMTEEIEARLESLAGSLNAKVDAICTLRQNYIRTAEALEAEEDRLKKRRIAAEKAANSLRMFLFGAMQRMGEDKIKTAKFTVYTKASPVAIVWTKKLEELPEGFIRVKIEPDLALVREMHKGGFAIPEGFAVEQRTHLEVR
jgi:hypothetical protein